MSEQWIKIPDTEWMIVPNGVEALTLTHKEKRDLLVCLRWAQYSTTVLGEKVDLGWLLDTIRTLEGK